MLSCVNWLQASIVFTYSDGFQTLSVRNMRKQSRLPSLPISAERVEQRSAFGVSQLYAMHLRQCINARVFTPVQFSPRGGRGGVYRSI